MNNLKKIQVVMLPTNEKANGCVGIVKKLMSDRKIGDLDYFNSKLLFSDEYYDPVHLYFLSDEKIEEGDWFIANQGVHKCLEIVKGDYPYKVANKYNNGEIQHQSKHWIGSKIIATTDKSLTVNYDGTTPISKDWGGGLLPQPSPQFITKYIEEWNAGHKIEWVNVKYTIKDCPASHDGDTQYQLIVDKNNCIVITKIKDSYSKEDFMNALHKVELIENKDYSKLWSKIEENL